MALFYVGDFSEQARRRLVADCNNGLAAAERIADLGRRPDGEGKLIGEMRRRADVYVSRLEAQAVLNDTPHPLHAFADTLFCQSGTLFSVPRPLCVVMPSSLPFGPGFPVDGVLGEGLTLSRPLEPLDAGRRLDDAYFAARLGALETAIAQVGPQPLRMTEVAAWAPTFYTPEGAAQRAPYYVSVVSTQDSGTFVKRYALAVRAGPMHAARNYLCFLGDEAPYADSDDVFGVAAADDCATLCTLGTAMRMRMMGAVATALGLKQPEKFVDTPCNLLVLPRGGDGQLVYHHGTVDTTRGSFLYDFGPVGPVLRYRRVSEEADNNAFGGHAPASACRFSEVGAAPPRAVPEGVVWPGKSGGATSAWANPALSPAYKLGQQDYDVKLIETYQFVCALVSADPEVRAGAGPYESSRGGCAADVGNDDGALAAAPPLQGVRGSSALAAVRAPRRTAPTPAHF